MKNIHILPTDKPSSYVTNYMEQNMQWQNIYITSDDEIKEEDWACHKNITNDKYQVIICTVSNKESIQEHWNKIILTTDQDLIKDGVQAIDDEVLHWFVKNPSCESVDLDTFSMGNKVLYNVGFPKEEPKQETLEEAAENMWLDPIKNLTSKMSFIAGAKWQAEKDKQIINSLNNTLNKIGQKHIDNLFKDKPERMYSEEELKSILQFFVEDTRGDKPWVDADDEWFEQFKK
jgi:hypothetical protein